MTAARQANEALVAGRVGSVLRGKWTLQRLLGAGGMAAVYAATHKIGTPAAIKILHPEIARSGDLRARFEQEARAVNRFSHPGAVDIRDIDVTDEGEPFLVMELLEGESLAERCQRVGTIPTAELLGWIDALLDVLAAAHAHGIVHRDIKPDNIFIQRDGRLKVLDFGVARLLQEAGEVHTAHGERLGTLAYMPPEQVLGQTVDARADLFAVGALLFRLISGRRLYEASGEAEYLVKLTTGPPPPLSSVAPGCDPHVGLVVDRALAFDRAERYPDAATMRADVRAVRQGQPPPYAAGQPPPHAVAPGSRHVPAGRGGAAAPAGEITGVTAAATPLSAPAAAAAPAGEITGVTAAATPLSAPAAATTGHEAGTARPAVAEPTATTRYGTAVMPAVAAPAAAPRPGPSTTVMPAVAEPAATTRPEPAAGVPPSEALTRLGASPESRAATLTGASPESRAVTQTGASPESQALTRHQIAGGSSTPRPDLALPTMVSPGSSAVAPAEPTAVSAALPEVAAATSASAAAAALAAPPAAEPPSRSRSAKLLPALIAGGLLLGILLVLGGVWLLSDDGAPAQSETAADSDGESAAAASAKAGADTAPEPSSSAPLIDYPADPDPAPTAAKAPAPRGKGKWGKGKKGHGKKGRWR